MQNEEVNFEIVPYKVEGVAIPILVRFDEDSSWLSQAQLADLFQTERNTICYHINNILRDGELTREATYREIRQVQNEGGRQVIRKLPVYSLDMIISIGYRVNSKRAVKFRQWATEHLKNIMTKGYSVQTPANGQIDGLVLQMIQALERSNKMIASMDQKVEQARSAIETLKPKADYCEQVLEAGDCLTTSIIAKDLGTSAVTLNALLHEYGVQYKQGENWVLYAEFQDKGLVDFRTHFVEPHNRSCTRMVWTPKGRAFIIDIIKNGLTPREALHRADVLCSPAEQLQVLLQF